MTGTQVVYHGTDSISAGRILEKGIDLNCGEESVDNGKGFYTTSKLAFAIQRAKTQADAKKEFGVANAEPAVIQIEVDLSDLETEKGLSVRVFQDCDYDWREFIFLTGLGRTFWINGIPKAPTITWTGNMTSSWTRPPMRA